MAEHSEQPADAGIDAIVFLPGMGVLGAPQPIVGIAQRIARALDFHHLDESRKFTAEPLPNLEYGQQQRREAEASRVVEVLGSTVRPVFDVYKVDYRSVLYSDIDLRGLRANLRLVLGLGGLFLRWLAAWAHPRRGLSFRKRLQLFIGGVVVFLATVAFLSLAVAAVSTVPWALMLIGPVHRALGDALDSIYEYLDYVYKVLIAAGGASLLAPGDIRKELDLLVGRLVALNAYLADDHRREAVQAQVRNALEAICESPKRYRQVIFMGYSFGSIVALDATLLCRSPDHRLHKYVETLVTIGCPAAFIGTYWPGFFAKPDNESTKALAKLRWINAYTPADLLGSQFKHEDGAQDAHFQPDDEFAYPEPLARGGGGIGVVNAFMSHGLYWEPEHPDQPAVFGPIVRRLQPASSAASMSQPVDGAGVVVADQQ